MQILSNPIFALNVRESPKFLRLVGNRVEEHDCVVRFLRAEEEIWPFSACVMHSAIIIGTVRSLWTFAVGQIPRSTELISSLSKLPSLMCTV